MQQLSIFTVFYVGTKKQTLMLSLHDSNIGIIVILLILLRYMFVAMAWLLAFLKNVLFKLSKKS